MYEVLTAIAAIFVIVVIVYLYRARQRPNMPSLYDRLGGIFAISAVVNDFSDALVNNPVVGKASKNVFLADWHKNKLDRLPGLKFQRTLWLCAVAGGPYHYHASTVSTAGKCPFSLENAHAKLQIAPEEFNAVALELSHSLDKFKVPAQEKSEVMAAFGAHMNEGTAGYNIAHNIAVNPIKC